MAKITIESIQETLNPIGWKVISESYKNLDQEMKFECAEGHKVYSTWKKLRTKITCPICEKNQYKTNDTPILKKKKGVHRILALDQASHITGYALFEDKQLVKWGTYEALSTSEDARVHEINEWLQSKIYNWEIDVVGLEGIQYQESFGVTTFQTLARLQGVLINTCYEKGLQYEVCPTNTWRHHCGVKGRSRTDRKKSMQLLIKDWYDISVSDDVADAIGIGKYVSDTFMPTIEIMEWE